MMKWMLIAMVSIVCPASCEAGLYLGFEIVNELPCQWRGLLPDLRRLRTLAVPSLDTSRSASLFHSTYADALLKLESAASTRALTADETADLGALYVRFGKAEKAVGVLREARRKHPEHFHIAANLGTAWQSAGDYSAAIEALEDAVRLAPPMFKVAEQAHLKLLQSRRNERANSELERVVDLNDITTIQRLALWLPNDGRILWLLGESAHATGDVRTAANILDGCVSDFGMKSARLRENRQNYRAAVETLEKKNEHAKTTAKLFKSSRALAKLLNESKLPVIDPKGINTLPWAVLTESSIERPFKPKFLNYVEALDGLKVQMIGSMRPVSGEMGGEVTSFLLTEYAIGCWFCDVPDATSMVIIDLKEGVDVTRNAIKVEGTFQLNRKDPEDYLFRIIDAKVRVAD